MGARLFDGLAILKPAFPGRAMEHFLASYDDYPLANHAAYSPGVSHAWNAGPPEIKYPGDRIHL